MKTKDITLTALFTAIICVCAPFAIPIGPVPISLATFAVYLAAVVLGAKKGTVAVIIYILLGAVGLPVFSGFGAGFGKLFGVTGGYILGYIPAAFVAGYMVDRMSTKKSVYPIALIVATAVIYVFGTIWFIAQTGMPLADALMACVIPFLFGDAVKIIVASFVGIRLRAYKFREAI